LTCNSMNINAKILKIKNNLISFDLCNKALCLLENEKVIVSTNENGISILGIGVFVEGKNY